LTIDSAGTIGFSNPASARITGATAAAREGVLEGGLEGGLAGAGFAAVDIPAVSEAQFGALSDRVALLDRRLGGFDLRMEGLEGGIASAMAMGGVAPVPGRSFTLTVAGANYGGEQALAGMIGGWVGEDLFVSAAVSGNTGDKRVGARVAASIGF